MTVFARILAGEIPADFLYQDELAVAFRDVSPQAPFHALVIPRKPLKSVADAGQEDTALLGHLLRVAARVAADAGLEEGGYRVVTNVGADGGQTVEHLHLHVLGGRPMGWPPG
ncbi:MAG: histidine triad nucleotide-binding protein [Planctomycetota bacterium]|nr:MAG: histidine triad nucleotide-binding protein [Planctomycetota bacterium]